MIAFYETKPGRKMPHEKELLHNYHVCLRMDFDLIHNSKWRPVYFKNLTKYYNWIRLQKIEKMEHRLVRLGYVDKNKSKNVLIMFTFSILADAIAFKLAWK